MIKLLHLEITDTCENCPYCSHNEYYSMNRDSGYDCKNEDSSHMRIADDYELKKKTKFLKIPDWCPLPTKEK